MGYASGPATYQIDAEHAVVYVTLSGAVTFASLCELDEEVMSDSRFRSDMSYFVDCRVLTEIPSVEQIRKLAIDRLLHGAESRLGKSQRRRGSGLVSRSGQVPDPYVAHTANHADERYLGSPPSEPGRSQLFHGLPPGVVAMTFLSRPRPRQRGLLRACAAIVLCVASASCHHIPPATEEYYRPDPISIHVESENFLDANVAIVVGGVTRRLGTVIGNTKGNFTFPWNNALMSDVVMTATMIGGGSGRSASLNVAPGQVIEFRIASVLRQTYATVHDP